MALHARPAARRGPWWLLAAVMLTSVAAVAAQRDPSPLDRRHAESLSRKLASMVEFGQAPAAAARRTPVSEDELNAFLRLVAADSLPAGVAEPAVRMLGDGGVAARAVVDLDAVRRQAGPGDWTDPRQWLTGRVPVEARGVLHAEGGVARFELSRAEVSGIPVPKALLQEVVTYYSRSPEFPAGVDLDAPFQLPARIREIRVNPREAVVVQQ